jgi:PAS domain S-box-containing protein
LKHRVTMKSYVRYFYAILAVPVIILTRFALLPITGHGTPFITLFPATVIIALLGGMGPAILTGVLGVLISDYFFIPPLHTLDFTVEFWSRTAVVVLTSIFVGYVGAMLRNARAGAEEQAAELSRSREDLKRAQTVALTGSWRQDIRQNKLTWSDEAYRIFGVPAGTPLTYESFVSLVHPDDRTFVDEAWRAALKGQEYDVEHRIVVDGQTKWVREKAELEFEKDDTILGAFGTVTDITLLKEAEAALLKEKDLSNSIIDSLPGVFYLLDEQGRFLRWNKNFEQVLGFTPEEMSKASAVDLFEGDDKHLVAERIREVFVKGISSMEAKLASQSGARPPYFFTGKRVILDQKPYLVGMGIDISERRQMEEYLRKSHDELEIRIKERTAELDEAVVELQRQVDERIRAEETANAERQRFNDVLETLPAYVCLLTPDYYMPFANKVFRDLFGYYPDRKCYEFLFNRPEPCENCETYKVLETNEPQHWEWTGPNGRNYDIFDFPFKDTDGSRLILEMGIDVTEQKRAQEALHASSRYARGLLEASLDPLVTISPEGKITDVNEATIKVTGVSRQQLIGTDFSSYFTEADKARQGYQQIFARGFVTDYPLTVRHKDGWLTDVLYNATVYKNQAGEVQGAFAAARDVTARKQVSQYARSLLEASLDPLVTISADGKITDVNDAATRVTGVSREQLIGTDFSNYFTEPVKAEQGYQQVFAKGFVTDYSLTIRHRNGHLTDVLYNATVYKNTHGEVAGVFAAARDVTERKQAEERQGVTNSLLELYAKRTSRKDYLDAAVEVIRNWSGCSLVGIRIKDDKGNIPYESCVGFEQEFLAFENDLRLDRDKCLCTRAILQQPIEADKTLLTSGNSFYSNDALAFVKGLSAQEAKEYRGNCMKWGYRSIAVVPIRYRDEILGVIHLADTQKDKIPLANVQFTETTISPLVGEAIHRFNAEAELAKYRLHLEDLVKQRTQELARSNKDLEQFAYVASHDLQEPLRAVSGFVSLLQRQIKDALDGKTKEYMDFALDGVARMQSLINGLLEYSRIDTRGKPPEKTDSGKSLEQALLGLQTSIKESDAKITSDHLPTVSIDPVQLTQLFQNLISNAVKFRSDVPPEIHVSASRQNQAWQFAVQDNGIGIEPQYTERIFLIFQRLHTRKKYPGTGIGLPLCKKIVERHGGRIWVESGPGCGSTFYFTVPDIEGAK